MLEHFNAGYFLSTGLKKLFYLNKRHNPQIFTIEISHDQYVVLSRIMHPYTPLNDPDFIPDRTMFAYGLQKITDITGHQHEHSSAETTREFLENPIIHEYLTRPANQIAFIDFHPRLTDSKSSFFHLITCGFCTKSNHENTDHYELKVYKYLPNIIAYRNSMITNSRFYTQGTQGTDCAKILTPMLQELTQDSTDISVVDLEKDFYHIKDHILTRQFIPTHSDEAAPRFLLFLNIKDDHATTILSVMDPVTNRALVTILLNSWISPTYDYYSYLKARFLSTAYYGDSMDHHLISQEKLSQQVAALFSIDTDDLSAYPQSTILDTTNTTSNSHTTRSICLIEHDYGTSILRSEMLERAIKMVDVDKIYVLSKNKSASIPKNIVRVIYKPTERFIDASHQLQITDNDQNCALYAFTFLKTIIAFLKQPKNAEEVFQLAQAVNCQDATAEDRLQQIFREELKSYLLEYYHAETGQKKSVQEITQTHLELRWNIGATSLAMFRPKTPELVTNSSTEAPCRGLSL